MANRRYIDFPIAASVGNNDIVLIWQDGLNKQTTKETLLQGSPQSLAGLTDVDISALTNGQILQYNSTTSKWENVDRTDINLSELGDVTIVAPANGQVLVYNSSTSKWENSSAGYVPYTGAVTTVNLGAQTIQAGSFVKAGGTSAQFLKANGSVDSTAYGTGTVTSVALTMPSAFSVGGSPITTAGTLAVTGAGTVGQYIRGDGSLADFPATTGGGSSVSYYLNGSVSQGTIGGVAYKELNRTPIFGAGTDLSVSSDGYIASFITDAGDPNKLEIPAGNWNLETYFSASSSGGTPSFYVELYKYDGTTFTLIASSSSSPELIAFGTNINPYFSTLAVPQTTLALTDRLAVRFYVETSGRTITLHTEDNHLCQVITTFTTGLTALNGLTSQVQFFAVGTNGTDFNIASASDTHTFNLPTATSTIRGALSSADWTTFNGKQNALTLTTTGTSGAATLVGSTLNIPQYQAAGTYVTAVTASSPLASSGGTTPNITIQQASGSQNGFLSSTDWTTFNNKQNALTNPVTGTGTSGQVAYFNGTSAITGESGLVWDATNNYLSIGGATANSNLTVSGSDNTDIFTVLAGANSRLHVGTVTTGTNVHVRSQNNYTLNLGVNNTNYLSIFNSGNVTIGTITDAGFKLDVNGTGRFTSNLTASLDIRCNGNYRDYQNESLMTTNGSVNEYGSSAAATPRSVSIFAGNTAVLNILTSGSVLIGTQTNPYSLGSLVVNHTSTLSRTYFQRGVNLIEIAPSDGSSANIISSSYTISGSAYRPLAFSARQNSADLYLTTGGNVLIGTTTDSGAKFRVFGTGVSANIYSDNNTYCLGLGYQGTLHGYIGGISNALQAFSANGGSASLNSVGVWVPGSDVKRKRNFENYNLGLDAILGLKPKYYHMDFQKDIEEKQVGLVAQEVRDFIPLAYEDKGGFIGLNYNAIIVTMVKAIQELNEKIK